MISDKPVITIKVAAIYDADRRVNYEVIEEHPDNNTIQSFFIDKPDMKQYIKDLIRSI